MSASANQRWTIDKAGLAMICGSLHSTLRHYGVGAIMDIARDAIELAVQKGVCEPARAAASANAYASHQADTAGAPGGPTNRLKTLQELIDDDRQTPAGVVDVDDQTLPYYVQRVREFSGVWSKTRKLQEGEIRAVIIALNRAALLRPVPASQARYEPSARPDHYHIYENASMKVTGWTLASKPMPGSIIREIKPGEPCSRCLEAM